MASCSSWYGPRAAPGLRYLRELAGRSSRIAPMDLSSRSIALLAIVNPIGVVPFFIHFTQSFSREQRQRTIRISSLHAPSW